MSRIGDHRFSFLMDLFSDYIFYKNLTIFSIRRLLIEDVTSLIVFNRIKKRYHTAYPQGIYWDHSLFLSILMIWPQFQKNTGLYYLQTILIYSLFTKTNKLNKLTLEKNWKKCKHHEVQWIILNKTQYMIKFLGAKFDLQLRWRPHIDHIRQKMSKSIGIKLKNKKNCIMP